MNILDKYIDLLPQNHPISKDIPDTKQELKKVCQDFEAIFLNQIMKAMRDTVPEGGLFEKGIATNIVESMHDEALTRELAQSGGIGLARQLYDELSKYV